MTGPQSTPDQRGDLCELAGLHGARLASDVDIRWSDVRTLIVLPGWESCPLASADVALADALGLPVTPLAP
ncbi:hypothetical protein [Streptomyces niveus]|uniref:hypothetical protein n=1 Tax=Streptomyces niveus TaxID=193462 RepID=UPI0036473B10